MSSWYETEKGYKRKKSSFYLRQHIHEQLVKVAEKNQYQTTEDCDLDSSRKNPLSFH